MFRQRVAVMVIPVGDHSLPVASYTLYDRVCLLSMLEARQLINHPLAPSAFENKNNRYIGPDWLMSS